MLWAVTIVLAEVPSGALADLVGRRRLVIGAAALMVVELATIGFIPLGNPDWILAAFVVNRICSGLAEAAASGADEALAYDSLVEAGFPDQWPLVLERLGRLTSIAMFVAMITGALVYDREIMGAVLGAFGFAGPIPQSSLIRIPVLMTLVSACFALLTAWRMREVGETPPAPDLSSVRTAFRQVLGTGRWILSAPFVLLVILGGLALDSVARQFVLLGSEYFRLVSIPTYLLGPISACAALFGIVSARISRVLVTTCRPTTNFLILSLVVGASLFGLGLGIPYWGALFALGPFLVLSAVGFMQSHYINAEVESSRRATALSFKGLALNVGMGLASIYYAGLLRALGAEGAARDVVFFPALTWLVPYFAVLAAGVLLLGLFLLRGGTERPGAGPSEPDTPEAEGASLEQEGLDAPAPPAG